MGAGWSLEAAVEVLDDEQLIAIVQQGFRKDSTRMDKILTIAKMRHLQDAGATATGMAHEAEATIAVALSVEPKPLPPSAAAPLPAALSKPATPKTEQPPLPPQSMPMISRTDATASSDEKPSTVDVTTSTDRMAALWTFQGHSLRELRSGFTPKKRSAPGADSAALTTSPQDDGGAAVDADGYAVLFGSCGREKKYARCSVCYFRGVRRNTAHYCACCQRPVCVRPRTYPGEEHPKICWNVLHVDADMIQRVDKRRARKLHAAATLPTGNEEDEDVPLGKSSSSDDQAGPEGSSARKQRKTTAASGKTVALPSPIPPLPPTEVSTLTTFTKPGGAAT